MSGGAFDYTYFDAEQLADSVEEMVEHAEEYNYPDEVTDELSDLEAHLRDSDELLRTVEWVASGDHGRGELFEVIDGDAE